MNIAEILKNCPQGTKLYCPIYGTVIFVEVDETRVHSIITRILNEKLNISFTKDGRLDDHYEDAECALFPSRENRDWNTFKVPQKEYDFEPFDKVLVRDTDSQEWQCDLFSHMANKIYPTSDENYPFVTISNMYAQCIPYKGNEDLLGTTNKPK